MMTTHVLDFVLNFLLLVLNTTISGMMLIHHVSLVIQHVSPLLFHGRNTSMILGRCGRAGVKTNLGPLFEGEDAGFHAINSTLLAPLLLFVHLGYVL